MLMAFLLAATLQIAPRGEIKLVVVDTDGHPLPGAAVTLLRANESTPIHVVLTGEKGEVTFCELPAGQYVVKSELSGFITNTSGPLPIELVNASPRLPAQLKIVLNPGPIWY